MRHRRGFRLDAARLGGILRVEYYERAFMAAKKFAISVPEEVMNQIDKAAAARGKRVRAEYTEYSAGGAGQR